ncbi:MAG: ABC transporter permease [Chloroflexi bacterium]|nr:ABC transporter permease [Chloroflexota bacterium]
MVDRIGRAVAAGRTSIALPIALGIGLFLVGAILIDGFASVRSVRAVLVLAAFVALASVGQTLVVVLGGIDLSIPFLVGVANVVGAKAFEAGLPAPVAIALTIGLTAGIGACNGFVSRRFSVHPLIVTLGIGTASLAAVNWWTAGFPSGSAPDWITGFVSIGATTGPIPVPPIVLLWAVVTAVLVIVERSSVYGRRLFALGANPRAAGFALIRPLRMWVATFAISGAFAGITGVLYLGFTGRASGTVGDPLLFQTIAAVVIGGTSLIGGLGGYARTALGAIVLVLLSTILLGVGVPSSLIQSALGVLIIILVSVYGREPRVQDTI